MKRSKELELAIINLLDHLNFKWMRVENYRCFACGQVQNSSAADWPDFFVYYPVLIAIECKTGKGVLSPGQLKVLEMLSKQNIVCILVKDSVDELLIFLKEKGYISG